MNITSIISEYNPFHKGHEYQIKKAKDISNCDAIAVIMSGNYVQRGEPSIIDKQRRAKSAIYGGADLVIELPLPYSCQNAETFAYGAISEVKKLHAKNLSFGCEHDDVNLHEEIASLQLESPIYNDIISSEIKRGISYPTAITNTINKLLGKDACEIVKSPNNVLALEYIKSSKKLNYNLNFVPVKRIGQNHNNLELTGVFDSASAIRNNIINNNFSTNSLSKISSDFIENFYNEYGGFNSLNNYTNYIYYKILNLGLNNLENIYDISEGLDNKIFSNIFNDKNIDNFILSIKSKRYTYSKIRRILLNILLDITKPFVNSLTPTNYIKVLAFNNKGREVLRYVKSKGTIIINKYSDYKKYNINLDTFEFTNKCTNIYYLPFEHKILNKEYLDTSVFIDDI